MEQKKRCIQTDRAPQAVGGLLLVSGQIPLEPQSGRLVEGDIAAQARQALENLKAVIEAAGLGLQQAVKCTCFLRNMDHFGDFNAVYAEYFAESSLGRQAVHSGIASLACSPTRRLNCSGTVPIFLPSM